MDLIFLNNAAAAGKKRKKKKDSSLLPHVDALIHLLSPERLNTSVTRHPVLLKQTTRRGADGDVQFNCHLNGIYNKRRGAIMAKQCIF